MCGDLSATSATTKGHEDAPKSLLVYAARPRRGFEHDSSAVTRGMRPFTNHNPMAVRRECVGKFTSNHPLAVNPLEACSGKPMWAVHRSSA
jgi:hypothetical protein